MQTADFDVNSFEYSAQSEEDKKLLVKFYIKPRQDRAKTLEEGRPFFKDTEYIDIRIPGDRAGGVSRVATDRDKKRFPEHYDRFKQRVEEPLDGTPLSEWPLVTRSQVEEFAFHNIKTVEHLAGMADTHTKNFMGMNNLKAKAVKWLEKAGEEAKVHQLTEQLAERDERIDRLEDQMKQLLEANAVSAPVESSGQNPDPIEIAPSLASDLDNVVEDDDKPAKVKKPTTRRRRRVKKADGKVQIDK